jgi:RNA polymerase sigma factor (sigma-70 family)
MLRDLRLMYSVGTLAGLTDRSLIESFRSANREGDPVRAEAALSAVIDRHAAMVWNVCRSVIRDVHDAEDAFQATFLILVRKADSLRVVETLGPWLHVVAYRTALGVRASTARRRDVERSAAIHREAEGVGASVAGTDSPAEVGAAIHAEIMRLPEPFRVVVILCDLEGLGYQEAAQRLELPLGTVQSRLARARRRLRKSLASRGIHPADANGTRDPRGRSESGWMRTGGLPAALAGRVGRLGALIASDPARMRATLAPSVQELIGNSLGSLRLDRLRRLLVVTTGGVLVVVGVIAGGALLYADGGSGQDGPQAAGPPGRRAVPRQEVAKAVGIPAPRRLKVVSGRGKTEVYAIDAGRRIPAPAGDPKGPFQTEEREIRWTAIVGTFDHHELRKALTTPDQPPLPSAEQLYMRVDLERQTRRGDGDWSDWEDVDMRANLDILDRVRAVEAERVALSFRVESLVDPLPWLTDGRWIGVDVDEFLPPERKGRVERPLAREERPIPPHVVIPRVPRERPPALMIRALDLSAGLGQSCRYRARVVLRNPEFPAKRQGPRSLFGPWSDATDPVTIP